MRKLDRLDHELLGEDRDGDRRSDGSQIVDRAAEPMGLAQDGDRDRAAGFVGPGPRDDVLVDRGDVAGGGRAALDLGNDVEAGRGKTVKDRSRRRGSCRDSHVVVEAEAGHLVADIGPAAICDLLDDVPRAAAGRLGGLRVYRRGFADGHAGALSPMERLVTAARRSSRSRSRSSPTRSSSIVSRARSTP